MDIAPGSAPVLAGAAFFFHKKSEKNPCCSRPKYRPHFAPPNEDCAVLKFTAASGAGHFSIYHFFNRWTFAVKFQQPAETTKTSGTRGKVAVVLLFLSAFPGSELTVRAAEKRQKIPPSTPLCTVNLFYFYRVFWCWRLYDVVIVVVAWFKIFC